MITTLLGKAIKKLGDMPKKRQDGYASMIFDELDSEVRWDKLFMRTSNKQIKKMEKILHDDLKRSTTSLGQFLKS